jgi:succinate dehydrogenase/fumarate reductase flavoprotein subunit
MGKCTAMKTVTTDVLVIGGGAAGLRAAIEAHRSKTDVLLVTKTPAGLGNCTAYAGGGFQASFGKMTPEEHFERTVRGGRFLGNQRLVEVMAREAASRLLELREFGVSIETGDGTASVRGSFIMNGTGLTFPLVRFAQSSGISILQSIVVAKLCKNGDGVVGAVGFDRINGEVVAFQAKSTVLATGGAGQVYSRTDTPVGTTGEGYAMAYEAGAKLIDMEFVQFFPFGLVEPGLPMFLFNPGIVEMGRLVNDLDKEFLREAGYSPGRDFIQHRDTLSKLICTEIHEGRGDQDAVLLDLKNPKETQYSLNMLGGFKEIKQKWLSKLDLTKQPVHIAPLVHYFMGGIEIDENGATNVPGLFAAGEVTGGVDGANRLGGNALTNTIVFGARAGRSAAEYAESSPRFTPPDLCRREFDEYLSELRRRSPSAGSRPREIRGRLQKMMVKHVGVIRTGETIENAFECLRELRNDLSRTYASNHWEAGEALEVEAMIAVSEIVTRCASERMESRGAHYRLDYPEENTDWLKNIVVERVGQEMRIRTRKTISKSPSG